ncbi:TraR/DksA family transcriptional regulator [Micromonospora sp. R77]|uniref:TraR/DksA family transcriptional regulator n=1 Tax=Micromonospora sp. R77 TaxID=2925836 RepID=UPI001F60B1B9|nr:TraR/DksA family transcriptional regulator [Micromonospora sp. R77]MCI4066819.1 TraR/DksA family transcriptional regulator [Micromonospora sp. R77]
MTHTLHQPDETLRELLENQLREHTDKLTELTGHARRRDRGGHDPDTLGRLIDTARQTVADTTTALRRMADGSYGRCERCDGEIPAARLEILPAARYCVPCQQRR